jgi:hypothetical protein
MFVVATPVTAETLSYARPQIPAPGATGPIAPGIRNPFAGRFADMMTRRIIETSLRFQLLVPAIAVDLMAPRVTQLRKAPVDALPEFTPPKGVSRHVFRRRFRPLASRSPETARIAGGLGE